MVWGMAVLRGKTGRIRWYESIAAAREKKSEGRDSENTAEEVDSQSSLRD